MKKFLLFSLLSALFVHGTQAQKNLKFTVNGVSFTMIYVEGGSFTMGHTAEQGKGCEDDQPPHTVTVDNYYIGETVVTESLWLAAGGSSWKDKHGDGPEVYWHHEKTEEYPANYITYYEAVDFCKKLNTILLQQIPSGYHFELPTEAKWEYAARGGKHNSPYRYAGSNNLDEVSCGRYCAVKQKKPNALGIYDMSGNIAEWCSDRIGGRFSNDCFILRGYRCWCGSECTEDQISARLCGHAGSRFGVNQGFRLVLVRNKNN